MTNPPTPQQPASALCDAIRGLVEPYVSASGIVRISPDRLEEIAREAARLALEAAEKAIVAIGRNEIPWDTARDAVRSLRAALEGKP